MPLKLKLQEQVHVDPAFWDAVKDLWRKQWKKMNSEILEADPYFRKMTISKNAKPMGMIKAYLTDPKAFDVQKTQLVTLPYVKFWTMEHNGAGYLVGLTKPILLSDGKLKQWQGPRYFVYVPVDYISRGQDGAFHFFPEGNETTLSRHPHHKAYFKDGVEPITPLDLDPSTCWGSFPTIVKGCVHSADTINLFRTLQIYLSRIDENSLLCHSWLSGAKWTRLPDLEQDPAPQPARRARR